MVFIQRDGSLKIKGVYALRQPGIAEEMLAKTDPAVLAYFNPPPTLEDVRKQEYDTAIGKDSIFQSIKAMTTSEFNAWWNINIVTEVDARGLLKRLMMLFIRKLL